MEYFDSYNYYQGWNPSSKQCIGIIDGVNYTAKFTFTTPSVGATDFIINFDAVKLLWPSGSIHEWTSQDIVFLLTDRLDEDHRNENWYTNTFPAKSLDSFITSDTSERIAYLSGTKTQYLRPNTQYAIWLIPSSNEKDSSGIEISTNNNIHYSLSGQLSTVRIDLDDSWHKAVVMIDNGTTWRYAIPYIDSGFEWEKCR